MGPLPCTRLGKSFGELYCDVSGLRVVWSVHRAGSVLRRRFLSMESPYCTWRAIGVEVSCFDSYFGKRISIAADSGPSVGARTMSTIPGHAMNVRCSGGNNPQFGLNTPRVFDVRCSDTYQSAQKWSRALRLRLPTTFSPDAAINDCKAFNPQFAGGSSTATHMRAYSWDRRRRDYHCGQKSAGTDAWKDQRTGTPASVGTPFGGHPHTHTGI